MADSLEPAKGLPEFRDALGLISNEPQALPVFQLRRVPSIVQPSRNSQGLGHSPGNRPRRERAAIGAAPPDPCRNP